MICLDHHKEIRYVVDFDPELARIITETKYLEHLGFAVPELARNVALQVGIIIVFSYTLIKTSFNISSSLYAVKHGQMLKIYEHPNQSIFCTMILNASDAAARHNCGCCRRPLPH
jgi:hypothetical protein